MDIKQVQEEINKSWTFFLKMPSLPKSLKLYQELMGGRFIDPFLHFPHSYQERKFIRTVREGQDKELITVLVTAISYDFGKSSVAKRKLSKVFVRDEAEEFDVVFFNLKEEWIRGYLPIGVQKIVSGELQRYHNSYQIIQPDHVGMMSSAKDWTGVTSVYPLKAGVMQKNVRKIISNLFSQLPHFPEWLPLALLQKNSWPSFNKAIENIHLPQNNDQTIRELAKERLCFDELFALQLAQQKNKKDKKKHTPSRPISGPFGQMEKQIKSLPFTLTENQVRVLTEILDDASSGHAMRRLLQGDVGSGKTVVAMLAMTAFMEKGFQTALLAPTDILANQHFQVYEKLFSHLPFKASLLTGKTPSSQKKVILNDLREGQLNLIIGTHALIEDNVEFKDLNFVVIDEQHRFGVEQRLSLAEKGQSPHILVMTATPIPRTMQLTKHGDLDISILKERPKHQKPIQTYVMPFSRIEDLLQGLDRQLQQGAKAYWVCPLVQESEAIDLMAATERYDGLSEKFSAYGVGLLHGRMKKSEKEEAIDHFRRGKTSVLVATTVVEVGVDIPDATIMIVEHAERFGLSQLHQLRGRVGRGEKASQCILFYDTKAGMISKKRLEIIRSSQDGFYIAEQDLLLRGGGDILGTQQSGLKKFKTFEFDKNPELYEKLLYQAHLQARELINQDPDLTSIQGKAARINLDIFGYQITESIQKID